MKNDANRDLPDLSVREGFVLAPILVLIVAMGLAPTPFLAPAKPSVDRLIARFQATEQRLRAEDPGLPEQVGTVRPAFAQVLAPAAVPVPAADPAHGSH